MTDHFRIDTDDEQEKFDRSSAEAVAFAMPQSRDYGIWDGGATKTVTGWPAAEHLAEAGGERVLVGEDRIGFLVAGGESSTSAPRLLLKHDHLGPDAIAVSVVPNGTTPALLGRDVIRHLKIGHGL